MNDDKMSLELESLIKDAVYYRFLKQQNGLDAGEGSCLYVGIDGRDKVEDDWGWIGTDLDFVLNKEMRALGVSEADYVDPQMKFLNSFYRIAIQQRDMAWSENQQLRNAVGGKALKLFDELSTDSREILVDILKDKQNEIH